MKITNYGQILLLIILLTALGAQAQISRAHPRFVSDESSAKSVPNAPDMTDEGKADAASSARRQTYIRPTKTERRRRFLSDAFGVPALIGATFGAGVSQIGNNPPEWGENIGGFGKRFASSYGTNVIRNSVSYGISEAFQLENRYEKSRRKEFDKRLRHAFVGSYTTRRKDGKRLPDFPYVIGTYSASVIANETWLPARFSYQDGLRDGTVSLGIRFGVNLLREFIFPK